MKTAMLALVSFTTLLGLLVTEAAAQSATVLPESAVRQQVEIRDLLDAPERVQGVIVNNTDAVLRNVVLFIAYSWRWNDERNPGQDTMSFGDRIEIAGDVPPGGSAGFAYMPTRMLSDRTDGFYQIDVTVRSFKRVHVTP
jgi:hypothetical protein